MSETYDAELAELRTTVMRAREQAMQITLAAQRARAGLAEQREQLRLERERAQQDLRDSLRNGELGPEQRALVERIERGETSWRDVMTGADGHRSALDFRESFGDRLEQLVEQLRQADPQFRDEHDATLRAAGQTPRGDA